MKNILLAIKPYMIGSIIILLFTLLSAFLSFLIKDNGITYFICGAAGAFGIGFLIYKAAKPISPLTVLIIIPCMFSGTFFAEYYLISKEKIISHIKPSEIELYKTSFLFEFDNYQILDKMKSSYTGIWRYKDKSSKIDVYTVPVVDSDWKPDDIVKVFAVCEKTFENSSNCENAFLPHKRFAKRIDQKTNHHYKSFEASVVNGVKDFHFKTADDTVFVELISDIYLYAVQKRRYGVIIFLALLFLWNVTSFWSVRHELKNKR
ncbi:MAG TPA: hypothetical protein DHW82_00805 [Spirochaetia bacterium]|nr:MAG: hypothetical protein A2Y41_10210 [Spirochaetes bacterium GWB1_36_13]HCL55537.1 hypothetical protein [Spirochaetia bacterium]